MIMKPPRPSHRLLSLRTLKRRLPDWHPRKPDVIDRLRTETIGFHGEKSIEYPLRLIDQPNVLILYDLRLYSGYDFYQIDILLITPYFILILEVKSYSGTLEFKTENGQLLQTLDDKEENRYANPLHQVSRHKQHLVNLLKQLKMPDIPVETFVVISNPSTILKIPPTYTKALTNIIYSDAIPTIFHQLEAKHQQQFFSKQQLVKLGKLLCDRHREQSTVSLLKFYKIDPMQLICGVHCPKCDAIPMKRVHGNWLCTACSHKQPDAHVHTLLDFVLFFSPDVKNKDLRRFLGLNSRHVMKYILKSSKGMIGKKQPAFRYSLNLEWLIKVTNNNSFDS